MHYSQAEIASKLGVTQQAIAKWETGVSTPSPTSISKLSDILGISTDVLLKVPRTSPPLVTISLMLPPSIPSLLLGKSDHTESRIFSTNNMVPHGHTYQTRMTIFTMSLTMMQWHLVYWLVIPR